MKKLILFLILLGAGLQTQAYTTYYLRMDGGDASQCTGTTNAAYPGSGSAQACALIHPFYLTTLSAGSQGWSLLAAGDSVIFEPDAMGNPGSYLIGQGPYLGIGQNWGSYCAGNLPGCTFAPLPDNVTFKGANSADCKTSGLCPKLVGMHGVLNVLDDSATQGVDIENIEITQEDHCSYNNTHYFDVIETSGNGTIGSYKYTVGGGTNNPPQVGEDVSVNLTTNHSGAFNVTTDETHKYPVLTVTPTLTGSPLPITAYSLSFYTLTLTAANSFSGGEFIYLSGFATSTFLNGKTVLVRSATSTTITVVNFWYPDASATESGTYTQSSDPVQSGTFTIALPVTASAQAESGIMAWGGYCSGPISSNPAPYNFANFGLFFQQENTNMQGPANGTIRNIYVHGLANSGTLGSKFNRTSGDTMTLDNLRIIGNTANGFNADSGTGGINNKSQGTINLTNFDAEWNGCTQVNPGVYNYCTDEAFNGSGDNLVMVATGGTWNWANVTARNGMQDCFDSLHTGDDPTTLPTITATHIYSYGCEGAAIKMSGGNVTLRNSLGISNCAAMLNAANFPSNTAHWNVMLGRPCRASDSFVLAVSDGHTLTVQNVVNAGMQGTAWDFTHIGPTGCSDSTCLIVFQNVATLGFPTMDGPLMGAIYYDSLVVNPFSQAGSVSGNNSWWNMKTAACPGDPAEVNDQCGDPKYVAYSDVNNLDLHLTASSPLISTGLFAACSGTDLDGHTCKNPPSIGPYQYFSPFRIKLSGVTLSGVKIH